jgi:predicted small secreted protein
MKKRMRKLPTLAVVVLATLLSACTTTGGQGRVKMTDTSERGHLDAKLNMTDFMAAADKLTDKMLSDDLMDSWYDKKPRLIVGKISNRTELDTNFPEEVYDRIVDIILASGAARIVGQSANEFDYILTGKINSTIASDGDMEQRQYRITLRVHTNDDELVGSWHEPIYLLKAKRPLF